MSSAARAKREKKDLLLRLGDQLGDRLEHARRDFLVEAHRADAAHESGGTYHSSRRFADEANLCRQELRRRGRIIGEAWKRTLATENAGRRGDLVAFATADATRRLAVERVEISNLPASRAGATSSAGYLVEVERDLISTLTAELRLIGRSDLHHWWDGLLHAATRTTPGRIVLGALLLGALLLGRACDLF